VILPQVISFRAPSRKTRIETPKFHSPSFSDGDLSERHPEKQGLKQHMIDFHAVWDVFQSAIQKNKD